jgi:ATP-dependent DNA helicase RecG
MNYIYFFYKNTQKIRQKMNNKINLNTSLQFIKGVGPKRAEYLEKFLGLKTINDLIFYFPRDWEDRTAIKNINSIKTYSRITIFGKIENTNILHTKSNIIIFEATISDNTGTIKAKWFRKKSPRYDTIFYLRNEIKKNQLIYITGDMEMDGIKVVDYEIPDKNNLTIHTNRIIPVYPAIEKIDTKFLRKIIFSALSILLKENDIYFADDFLPKNILKKYNFLDFRNAIYQIHFPDNIEMKNLAYSRLAFNSFFLLEIVLMKQYSEIKKQKKAHKYELKKYFLTPFKNSLSFEFTPDQKKVINEIFNDMLSDYPMNRLLQGDVGSGKTIVALSSILLATENGFQSAIMAPTEVLAKQHFETFSNILSLNKNKDLKNIKIGFLAGSLTKKQKNEFCEKLKSGYFDIIVGTHALFSENIEFKNLKLIIIDEQHKFGVNERLKLRDKSILDEPDILVMTATPIPRSLAMSIYGDLDVSIIKTMPNNRKQIDTFLTGQKKAIELLIEQVKIGRQGYIVYPVIDEDNKLELKSAKEMFEKLNCLYFEKENIKAGLLHGKMKQIEKNEIMQKFLNNEIQVLISTTVIEVGVNVPNATVMIIEHAERFGLSTLHQLRGRVGRAEHKSYCFLVPSKMSINSKERLSMMLKTNDGFLLAEKDLEIRGPGEFLGKNQHGFLDLEIGDISKDIEIIEIAKNEAINFLENIPNFSKNEIELINQAIKTKYGETLNLLKV